YLLVSVGQTQSLQGSHLGCGAFMVSQIFEQAWEARHVGLGNLPTRVKQVLALPGIGMTTADRSHIGPGALGAPQERTLVNELARNGVVAVALSFSTERTDLLGVTDVTTFTDVDVTAFKFQRRYGLKAFNRFVHFFQEK